MAFTQIINWHNTKSKVIANHVRDALKSVTQSLREYLEVIATGPRLGPKLLAFGVAALCVFVLIYTDDLGSARQPCSPDEEVGWTLSKIVSEGGIPYRDFAHEYMPLTTYTLAALTQVLGGDLAAQRLAGMFLNCFVAPCFLFLAATQVTGKTRYGLFALGVYFGMGGVALAKGTLFTVALFAIVRLLSRMCGYEQLIGLVLACLFWGAQEFAAATGFGVVFSLFVQYAGAPKHALFRALLRLTGGVVIVLVPLVVILLAGGSLHQFVENTFIKGLIITPEIMNLPFAFGIQPGSVPYWMAYWIPVLFAISILSACFGRREMLPVKTLLIVTSILMFSTALGRSDEGHIRMALLPAPVLCALMIRDTRRAKGAIALPTAIAVSVVYLLVQYRVVEHNITDYTWQLPIAVCVGTFLFLLSRQEYTQRRGYESLRIACQALIVGSVVFFAVPRIQQGIQRAIAVYKGERVLLAHVPKPPENSIFGLVEDPAIIQELGRIRSMLDQSPNGGRQIFIYPRPVTLYYWFGRRPPTSVLQYHLLRDETEGKRVVADLEERVVQYVILDKVLAPYAANSISFYILTTFETVLDGSRYSLLKRRSSVPTIQMADLVGAFRPVGRTREYEYRNYLKVAAFPGSNGSDNWLFQHPPFATDIEFTAQHVLSRLQAVEIQVAKRPEYKDDTATASIYATLKTGEERRVFTYYIAQISPTISPVQRVDLSGLDITRLRVSSNAPHGTFWKIAADLK